jgi:hypothetical protein
VVVNAIAADRYVHIRKRHTDATAEPVWCGAIGVASITEAWGYYGHGGNGHDEVCRGCINAQRAARRGAS